jgi:hypothetical protein
MDWVKWSSSPAGVIEFGAWACEVSFYRYRYHSSDFEDAAPVYSEYRDT